MAKGKKTSQYESIDQIDLQNDLFEVVDHSEAVIAKKNKKGTFSQVADAMGTIFSGSITNVSNLGTGEGLVFKELSGSIIQLKTLKAGSNISLSNDSNEITINSSGGIIPSGSTVVTLSNFTLNENMAIRDLCVLNANGTIRNIQYSAFGEPYIHNNDTTSWNSITSLSESVIVVRYVDDNSSLVYYKVGIVSEYDISFGSGSISPLNEPTSSKVFIDKLDSNRFAIGYKDTVTNYGMLTIGTVSGTTVNISSGSIFTTENISNRIIIKSMSQEQVIVAYRDIGSGEELIKVGTVTGTTTIFGSGSAFYGILAPVTALTNLSDGKLIVTYRKSDDNYNGTSKLGTISGNSISFGSETEYDGATNTVAFFDSLSTINSSKFVIVYQDNANSGRTTCKIGTVSGTAISYGSAYITSTTGNGSSASPTSNVISPFDTQIVVVYRQSSVSQSACAKIGIITGTNISFGVENISVYSFLYPSIAFLKDDVFAIGFTSGTESNVGKSIIGSGDPTRVADRIFGILQEGGISGSIKPVATFGEKSKVHSSLIPGRLYYYNTLSKNGVTLVANNYLAGPAYSSTDLKIVTY